jgi:predicted peroxiredoxin
MKSKSAWIRILFAAVAICLGCALTAGAQGTRDGVFIHISHGADDPHRVLMALSMAGIMCEDHDVLVYFDIKGVEAVLKDSKNLTYAHFASSKDQLATLSRKGVILMACPGCLKAAGKTKDDLATGVKIADKKAFFSFTKGRILTLDY